MLPDTKLSCTSLKEYRTKMCVERKGRNDGIIAVVQGAGTIDILIFPLTKDPRDVALEARKHVGASKVALVAHLHIEDREKALVVSGRYTELPMPDAQVVKDALDHLQERWKIKRYERILKL